MMTLAISCQRPLRQNARTFISRFSQKPAVVVTWVAAEGAVSVTGPARGTSGTDTSAAALVATTEAAAFPSPMPYPTAKLKSPPPHRPINAPWAFAALGSTTNGARITSIKKPTIQYQDVFLTFSAFRRMLPIFLKPPLPIEKPSRYVVFGEGDFSAFDPLPYLLAVHSADANFGLDASPKRQNRHGRTFFKIIER